jgi:hypothetical protein
MRAIGGADDLRQIALRLKQIAQRLGEIAVVVYDENASLHFTAPIVGA